MELTINNIHKTHYKGILHYFLKKIRNKEQCEEMANDVFIKVHEHLHEYDENKSAINTWLFSIAKNIMIDFFRKKKLETVSIGNFIDENGHDKFPIGDNNTPQTEMENNELGSQILDAIVSLPSKYVIIVDKFFIEQHSLKEIAVSLDIPVGTVKASIYRAKEMLRNKLSNL